MVLLLYFTNKHIANRELYEYVVMCTVCAGGHV